jgi:outer membrane protein OmpA-like peptidoglycan-associated protein
MKHFMNFKRGAAVLSAIAMAVSVSAQTENYVPKHEFSISGFGGLSTLNYKVNIPQNPYIDGVDRKMGLGGGVGLDWTYHFSKHWGLRLGVQAALYNAKAKKDFTLNGIYMRDQALIDIDGKLQEKQRAVYAQVPLMVQWMTPAGKNHFYVALGGKFGMRLWDNYKQIVDAKPTYHPVYNAPTRAAYDPEGIHESYRGTIGLKRFDVMGSAEVGMRWTLGNGVGLYTGLYFDYGFLNTAPKAKGVSATMGEFDVEDVRDMSILSAELRGIPQSQNRTVAPTTTNFRLVDKVHKMAGGLVLRLSFGKGKAVVAPCPECPIVEPIEKIKEVYHHDTIRIVKEIPQEIKDKMKDLSSALFAFNKFDISPKAQTILNDVATWLKKNPQMKCELSGHTDGKGSVAYNQKLSEQRAQAVYDYLVKAGVSSDNLTWKGYGKSEPIATNDTAEGRQLNRRVELRLIK